MELNLKHIPLGSTLMLGGDTEKRLLYVGKIQQGFYALYKSQQEFMENKKWQVLAEPCTRIKNVTLPIGFDKENMAGWARGLVK